MKNSRLKERARRERERMGEGERDGGMRNVKIFMDVRINEPSTWKKILSF